MLYRHVRGGVDGLPLFEGDEDLVEVLGTSVEDRVLDFQQ